MRHRPGLITAFQPNAYYPSHEAYLADLVASHEARSTEAIAASGFQLQLDCPDLAMSRHTGYQDLTEAEILQDREKPTSRRSTRRPPEHRAATDAHARLLGEL